MNEAPGIQSFTVQEDGTLIPQSTITVPCCATDDWDARYSSMITVEAAEFTGPAGTAAAPAIEG